MVFLFVFLLENISVITVDIIKPFTKQFSQIFCTFISNKFKCFNQSTNQPAL
jgi:hypothetical protein